MISVNHIADPVEFSKAKEIRYTVFVIGQKVPPEIESDEYENSARHYLAYFDNTPAGAARWRFTKKGIKLERFAVLEDFRGKGIGSSLVKKVLSDISNLPEAAGKTIYLHAQIDAIQLYLNFGFKKDGEEFEEAGIRHYNMILP